MDSPVSILYTQNIRGDLELLPRLYTFLRQLRQQAQRFEDEDEVMQCLVQPPARRLLVVDVGDSCAPEAWHCQVTGGRSVLTVLDGMGYDAANAAALTAEAREKLAEVVQLGLVDEAHAHTRDGVAVALPGAAGQLSRAAGLVFVLSPQPSARLEGRLLYPRALRAGEVGVAHVAFDAVSPRLAGHDVFAMPSGMRPEATIAGTVDFVLSEARYYQKRQGQ